ncbi:MAG: serine hydrolase [Actinobacteria bacterium]|nr:serine hydrolase [Actinomycetota bacterium]
MIGSGIRRLQSLGGHAYLSTSARPAGHRPPIEPISLGRNSLGVGTNDVDRPDRTPGTTTPFTIGSITKTFIAAAVMSLRDEGRRDYRTG